MLGSVIGSIDSSLGYAEQDRLSALRQERERTGAFGFTGAAHRSRNRRAVLLSCAALFAGVGAVHADGPDRLRWSGLTSMRYVGNDPLNATDPMGLWSPAAHDAILQFAFGSRLAAVDIQILQHSSRVFDSRTQGFGPDMAPLHSLRAEGQSAAQAITVRNIFIEERIVQAQRLYQADNAGGALEALGQALHPIMDASSPMHTTADGQPRLWTPSTMLGHSPFDCGRLCGGEQTRNLTPGILDQQRDALNTTYDRVFSDDTRGMSNGSARPGTPGK